MKRIVLLFAIFGLLFPFIISCEEGKGKEIGFSYKAIMDREFRYETGQEIPVTVERSIETEGDISPDGDYLYYSSNRENGNYDIYLREMDGITTVRLTRHAAKDREPAISPNGKLLAFVSHREDPEGDIYVLDINAKKIISRAKKTVTDMTSLDRSAENLTQIQDRETGTVLLVKDAGPCWSPDGKLIAFSSKRDGIENIWLMEKDGDNPRRITDRGGLYPRFSKDGREIIFISYRDGNSYGDIYTIDIASKKERRLTELPGIKLFPSFLATNREIIYTLIDRDTNGDGKTDLRDNAILQYRDLASGDEYPLTHYSQSSFNARWLPIKVFKSRAYDAILLFSDQRGDNINLNLLPETGIIPKKGDALSQFILAQRYREELQDREKYLLCLERVFQFFGDRKDLNSMVYSAKSLSILIEESSSREMKNRYLNRLKKMSEKGDVYLSTLHEMARYSLQGKSPVPLLRQNIEKAGNDAGAKQYMPYLMEELGSTELRAGNTTAAMKILDGIINDYPAYRGIESVHYKKSFPENRTIRETLSPSTLFILQKGSSYNKIQLSKHLLEMYAKPAAIDRNIILLKGLLDRYEKSPQLESLFAHALGRLHMQKNRFDEATQYLQRSQKATKNIEFLHYRNQILLGEIALDKKQINSAEEYFASAVKGYFFMWQEPDYRDRLKWLVKYYEEYGERAESAGNYRNAVSLYDKYASMLTIVHRKRAFDDIYDLYAPRAHVYYINATIQLKHDEGIQELEKKYEDGLTKARMDFDKAHLYGLGYLYTLKAVQQEGKEQSGAPKEDVGLEGLLVNFTQAISHIDWAIFIDDAFIESYILKSWIYQYVDMRRAADKGEHENLFKRYFSPFLWEKNIAILELALDANNENLQPEKEGNVHLNMANNFFLLNNFTEALKHYTLARKYKNNFSSSIEEALFCFHTGYCYWQNGEIEKGRREIQKSLFIYNSLSEGANITRYKNQLVQLFKYYALFYRWEEKYEDAIAWYQKILAFASKYRVKIDRARYLQEIAYCYSEVNDYTRATAYLDQADLLLKKYPDDEKAYKLQWRFFGIIPFSFIDLGVDSAVIGESKIFTHLDTRNKKLLNLSLLQSVSTETGNYAEAARFLERKIRYLEKRDTEVDREALITTYNNLGYYSFKSGNYSEARRNFELAWRLAVKGESLNGALAAIINLTTLYAFSIDNKPDIIADPAGEAGTLIGQIESYRSGYEESIYNQKLEELKVEAESEKRTVLESEKEALRQEVRQEAQQVYYRLDIALGTMLFYNAEISRLDLMKKPQPGAYRIFKSHESLFMLYRRALTAFQSSIEEAENRQDIPLQVKILLNSGACYTGMGAYDDAYATYIDAVTLAEQSRSRSLQFTAFLETGNFLKSHGRTVEGEDFPEVAAEYYQKAIAIIEDNPVIYSDNLHNIEKLYDSMCEINIISGKWKNAFYLTERKYTIEKIMLINRLSPEFSDREDLSKYRQFRKLVSALRQSLSEISSLNGETSESSIAESEKILESRKSELKKFIQSVKNEKPLLASYFSMGETTGLPGKGTHAVKFFLTETHLYAFTLHDGTLGFKTINLADNKNISADLSKLLRDNARDGYLYIVLNQSFISLIGITGSLPDCPPCTFVPSISSIDYIRQGQARPAYNMYYSGSGLAEHIPGEVLPLTEGTRESIDYTAYSVLADTVKNEIFTPAMIFSTRMKPALILKNIDRLELSEFISFFEASLYASVLTTVITVRGNESDIGAAVKGFMQNGFAGLPRIQGDSALILPCGRFPDEKAAALTGEARKEKASSALARYKSLLKERSFDSAGIELNRWYGLSEKNSETLLQYSLEKTLLLVLQENLKGALTGINTSLEDIPSRGLAVDSLLVWKVYLLLYSGEIAQASRILGENPQLDSYRETAYFRTIIEAAADSVVNSLLKFKTLGDASSKEITRTSAVPENRLVLLYAEYIHLLAGRADAIPLLRNSIMDIPLSDREILSFSYLSDSTELPARLSERASEIGRLKAGLTNKIRPTAHQLQELFVSLGIPDRYSAPAMIFMLENPRNRNIASELVSFFENINFETTHNELYWPDAAMFLTQLSLLHAGEGDNKTAMEIIDHELSGLKATGNITLLKKLLFSRSKIMMNESRYADAYKNGLDLEKMTDPRDPLYLETQMLLLDCETRLAEKNRAESRVQALAQAGPLSWFQEVQLLLLKARIELNRLADLKQAGLEDGKPFEKMVLTVLDSLGSNPKLCSSIQYTDLFEEVFDEFINYKMKTGQKSEALAYADLKNRILVNMKLADTARVSGEEEKADMKAFANGSKDLSEVLTAHPGAATSMAIQKLPLDKIQSRIPDDSVLLFLSKIRKDTFVWALTAKSRNTEILADSIPSLEKILAVYRENLMSQQNTVNTSIELDRLFSPIKKYYRDKKKIIIITDHFMEQVPYEIMGEQNFLIETHTILFLPSLFAVLNNITGKIDSVEITGESRGKIFTAIEDIAMKESGLPMTVRGRGNGIAHIFTPLNYDRYEKSIQCDTGTITGIAGRNRGIYLPSVDFTRITQGAFSLRYSVEGVEFVIFNNSFIHDNNNAYFVEVLYSRLARHDSVVTAFEKALTAVKDRKDYRHAAYWGGIRLYCNGL